MALAERQCARAGCPVVFRPLQARRDTCSDRCRNARRRDQLKAERMAGGPVGGSAPAVESPEAARAVAREQRYRDQLGPLVDRTRAALTRAGVAESPAASAVLGLAVRIEDGYHESGPALSALTRAFDAGMASALGAADAAGDAAVEARRGMQQARFRLAARRAG